MSDQVAETLYPDPWEKFTVEMEQRMLDGETEISVRRWAVEELGVPIEHFERLKSLILRTWSLGTRTMAEVIEERYQLRAMYLDIHRQAKGKGKFKEAIKALDSLRELMGLDAPSEINLSVGSGEAPGQLSITAQARGEFAQLIETMRERLESPTLKKLSDYNVKKVSRVIDANAEEVDD